MTYRATQPPRVGGFQIFLDYIGREYTRIQRAFSTKAEFSSGTFTPGFDFATTGDLSNSYAGQDGDYWLIGNLCYYTILVSVTPTHTTASGSARITGMPFVSDADAQPAVGACYISGAGVNWGTNRTADNCLMGQSRDYLELITSGSQASSNVIDTTEVTSGVAVGIRLSGFYPIQT